MPNGLCDTRIQTTCCRSCPLRWAVGRVDNYSLAAVSSIQTRNRFLFSGVGRPCLHLGGFDSTAAAGCLAVRARAHHGNSRPERLSPQSFSNGYLAAHAADGTLKLKLANGPDTVSARTTCLTEFRAPPMEEKFYTAITMHARRTSGRQPRVGWLHHRAQSSPSQTHSKAGQRRSRGTPAESDGRHRHTHRHSGSSRS